MGPVLMALVRGRVNRIKGWVSSLIHTRSVCATRADRWSASHWGTRRTTETNRDGENSSAEGERRDRKRD